MARYRIHRMKDTPRENFRWAPHTSGLAIVKPKDFESIEDLEAATPYAAWRELQAAGRSLRPGDLLEVCPEHINTENTEPSVPGQSSPDGQLLILKYIGFEPAGWFVPAAKPEAGATGEAVS
ncbi:MAG TPA: hypothetical protein VLJ11_13370 [Bryobacteraceae bacterium]|nr:hypothetical protein [Bryobacteraceae bacterium]